MSAASDQIEFVRQAAMVIRIEAAVLAERERCAKIADAEAAFCKSDNPRNIYAPGACMAIAAKIREVPK